MNLSDWRFHHRCLFKSLVPVYTYGQYLTTICYSKNTNLFNKINHWLRFLAMNIDLSKEYMTFFVIYRNSFRGRGRVLEFISESEFII